VFSDKLLFLDVKENGELIQRALQEGYVFHFVNEGYKLRDE